jgi:hypothetical protein
MCFSKHVTKSKHPTNMDEDIYCDDENDAGSPPRRPLTRREKYLRKKERDRWNLRTAVDAAAE